MNRDDEILGPFTGDDTEHIMTWRGDLAIPAGRGQDVYWRKLKFYLRNPEVFSSRFTDLIEDPDLFKTEKEW